MQLGRSLALPKPAQRTFSDFSDSFSFLELHRDLLDSLEVLFDVRQLLGGERPHGAVLTALGFGLKRGDGLHVGGQLGLGD